MQNLSNFFDFKLFSKAFKNVIKKDKYGIGPSFDQNEVLDIQYYVCIEFILKKKICETNSINVLLNLFSRDK